MAFTPKSTLGPYEILGTLGAGGMGEVYRARDSRLGREVAVKVLPDSVAHDVERLLRFKREAQVLAVLNHPNIASVYGLEESNGHSALVMELVEGQTLADRLELGAIPLTEALQIAKQIAEALEAAHEKGIVHRDLKPANIKISPEGTVKVLDFGLAKAMDTESSSSDLTKSPTITAMKTSAGVILGTASYMSPEQAKGKSVDRRADIWSFGVVLYEMLSGGRLFTGETASEVLAHVITKDPDWTTLPGTVPRNIRRLLQQCLVKDPKQRLQAIGDARIAIDEHLSGKSDEGLQSQTQASSTSRRWMWMALTLAGIALSLGAWLLRPRTALESPVLKFSFSLPSGQALLLTDQRAVSIAPDGSRVVYAVESEGKRYLWMRRADEFQAHEVTGSESARGAVFSPDGKWLIFAAEGKLKKVPINGGPAVALADVGDPRGYAWVSDSEIVYSPRPISGLFLVSANGGTPRPLTELRAEQQERSHRWPYALPGGKVVLFTTGDLANPDSYDNANIEAVDIATGKRRVLLQGACVIRYLPEGTLVFARGGALYGVAFDPERLEVKGSPVPLLEHVSGDSTTGVTHATVSDNGALIYVQGEPMLGGRVGWTDRYGAVTPLDLPVAAYRDPKISPDGKKIALISSMRAGADVWIYDLEHKTYARLTYAGTNITPLWSRDSKTVYFCQADPKTGAWGIWSRPADGSRNAELLMKVPSRALLNDISPDGKYLYYSMPLTNARYIVQRVALEKDAKPESVIESNFNNLTAEVSPDGAWLAFMSDESGRPEIYVRDVGSSGARWQVSSEGGFEPHWSHDGRELFYHWNSEMYTVTVQSRPVFSFGTPKKIFGGVYELRIDSNETYGVDPSGKRFLMLHPAGQGSAQAEVRIIWNWQRDVQRIMQEAK